MAENTNVSTPNSHMEVTESPNARGSDPDATGTKTLMDQIKPSGFGLKRTYSTIDISADKWLLINDPSSIAKLENPPSLADGLCREIEMDLRYLGCELIQSGAILLKLPQTAAATGQILFQRYYYQKSFVRHNFEHTVMACLLLASKIEEEPRRPRDVINVYNRLKQLHNRRYSSNPNKKLDHLVLDQNYVNLKNLVIKTERRILNVLGFVVHVHHPHKLIYVYLNSLNLLKSKDILQKAWSYMNDGLRTDIFLRYKPETIACACIHLAARTIENPVVLPKTPFPWFELFDASDRDILAICQILLQLYNKTEVPRLSRLSAHVEKLHNKITGKDKVVPPKEVVEVSEPKDKKDRKKSPAIEITEGKRRSPSATKKRSRSRDRSRDRYRHRRSSPEDDRRRRRSRERKDRDRHYRSEKSPKSKKSKYADGTLGSIVNGNRR